VFTGFDDGEVSVRFWFFRRSLVPLIGGLMLFLAGIPGASAQPAIPFQAEAAPTRQANPAAPSMGRSAVPVSTPGERQLIVGGSIFPLQLHPLLDATNSKSWIMGLAFRSLIAVDRNSRMICQICTELPTLGNGRIVQLRAADGHVTTNVTFTLRPGLVWGDGTPLTSSDVAFGLQVGRHPALGTHAADLFQRDITAITVHDSRSFTLHRSSAGCSLNELKDLHPLPAHLERPVFDADPVNYRINSLYSTSPTTPGLWNGPYRVQNLEQGTLLMVERNPAWTGPRPVLDRIGLRGFATTTALASAFMAGLVDALPGEFALRPPQAEALALRAGDRARLVIQPALVHEHLDINHDNPVLASRDVRLALLTGLDRASLVQSVLGGGGVLSSSDIAPGDPVYVPPPVPVRFDPTEAGALLDRAGWRRGPDGWRVGADGQKMVVDIITMAGHAERERTMAFIQKSWQELGVTVRTSVEPARLLYGKTQPERRFPGMVLFSWREPPGFPRRSAVHSHSIPGPENHYAGQNYGGYRNPDLDRVIEGIEGACSGTDRPLWAAYQRLYEADLPTIPLFFWNDAALLPRWLEGAEPTGHQYPATLWVEDWKVTDRVAPPSTVAPSGNQGADR
jgi:peptide/nickel transport system substrate-binding protein